MIPDPDVIPFPRRPRSAADLATDLRTVAASLEPIAEALGVAGALRLMAAVDQVRAFAASCAADGPPHAERRAAQ